MRITKPFLLASIAVGALVSAPAAAQEVAGADAQVDAGADDGVIIVTARRQSETLQDTPASVTVLTADALEKTGADNASDFAQLTPGVTIVTGTAEAGDTQVNIRGINGARDAESSIALVVDGILKTNTAQLNQVQGTLRQAEILKGPQGALYGRNAAAGAVVLQTLKPGSFFEGAANLSYANEKTIEGTAHIAGPIAENLGFVLSGYYRTTDGFFTNTFLNDKVVDDQEVWTVDGRVVADLSPATELDVKARYSQLRGASINFNASFHLPNFAGVNPAFYEDINTREFGYQGNIRPTNSQDSFDVSAKIEHQFDSAILTAWALYSDISQELTADGTSADFARYISAVDPAGAAAINSCFASTANLTGFPINQPGFIGQIPVPFIFAPANGSTFGAYSPTTCDGTQLQTRDQKDISAEIRLASDTGGPLSWQVGAYYLNIDREVGVSLGADTGAGVSRELFNAPGSSNPTSLLLADGFDTNVYAAFASLEYQPSEKFSAGLALRYDIEDRTTSSLVPTGAIDPFTGGPINPGQAFGPLTDKDATYKQLQPKVTLSYRPTPDVNIYANWGIGFKSGGFNNQGSAALVDANFNQFIGANVTIRDDYDKEVSSAFELGVKGNVWDGRLTFDLAGYYTEIDDMQFFEFFVGSFGLLRVVSNIDEVEVYGAELNMTAEIVDGWRLFGAFNVTESEIKANSSRTYTVGNKSPYTADYTINFGSEMDVPLSNSIDLLVRADYRVTGPTWFHTVQDQTRPTLFSGLLPISALALPGFVGDARYDVAQRDAFGVFNLRAGIDTGQFSVTVFAENLFNEKYINEAIPAIEFGGSFISPGARRLIGVEIGAKF
ncbi:TonB-dependent receptor [Qipengyuania sp. DSG2-2]|uniref:TonB-dependent receptor n=1 Tax=Qipengyuania sp. DGS2-2 TaxID=3349631 RepID=UPI0036D2C874